MLSGHVMVVTSRTFCFVFVCVYMDALWNGGVQNNSGNWKLENILNSNKAKVGAPSKFYYAYDVISIVSSYHDGNVKAILSFVCVCALWNGGIQNNSGSWKLKNILNGNKARVGIPSKSSQKLYYYAYDVMSIVQLCHNSHIKAIFPYVCGDDIFNLGKI